MRARLDLPAPDWRLYYVTDTALSGGPERVPGIVEEAVLGGAGIIQVRDKELDDADFAALTRACIQGVERAFDRTGRTAAVFVNDRLAIAEQFGTHFHQGQGDGDISHARSVLGEDLLIGLSISHQAQLDAELADPYADVIGLSPIWSTPTKVDTDEALGLDGARQLVEAAGGQVATVAIGGINLSNAASVIATGVDGICVVSAIAAAPDPRAAATSLLALWSTP